MPVLNLRIGNSTVIVNTDKITPDQMDELSEKLAKVAQNHSIFGKYPLQEGETLEEWRERVEKEIPENNKKKEGESSKDYLARIFKPQADKKKLVFDTLQAVSEIFKGNISYEDFRSNPYTESKGFLVKVLKSIDFPTGEYE